jgi:hypothetical protein
MPKVITQPRLSSPLQPHNSKLPNFAYEILHLENGMIIAAHSDFKLFHLMTKFVHS